MVFINLSSNLFRIACGVKHFTNYELSIGRSEFEESKYCYRVSSHVGKVHISLCIVRSLQLKCPNQIRGIGPSRPLILVNDYVNVPK